jgi:hypothetical protein
MSMSPHTVHNHRWGLKYGQELKLVDSLAAALEDQNTGRGEVTPMGSESAFRLDRCLGLQHARSELWKTKGD